MNMGTQTPDKFYNNSQYPLLVYYGTQINELERQLLKKRATGTTTTPKTIQIGPHGTQLPNEMYLQVDWSCPMKATRMLAYLIFGRETLGTHTLTGRAGYGAVKYRTPTKPHLPSEAVQDIVHHIMSKFGVEQKKILELIRRSCKNSARQLKTIEAKSRT